MAPRGDPDAIGDAIASAIASGEPRSLRERYLPAATFEAHLPDRSASVRGRTDVLRELVGAPCRVGILAERSCRGGVVLRMEASSEPAGPVARRTRHLIHLERGLVSRHVVYPERAPDPLPELPEGLDGSVRGMLRERVEPTISGCLVERWTLRDGRVLFAKHLRARDSWLMRASGDRGREAALFRSGVLQAVSSLADHAVVGAVREPGGWLLLSEDRSVALARPPRTPGGRHRLLGRVVELGERLRGASVPAGCPIDVRLRVFSPATAVRERAGSDLAPKVIGRGWELFAEMAPPPVATAVPALAEEPAPLVEALAELPATLVHGDLRVGNVGWSDGRAVLVDWGLAMTAPPVVDLAWWLFNAGWRSRSSLDRMLAELRSLLPRADDRAVALALLATLVQAGSYFGFEAAQDPDPAARRRAREGLAWWSGWAAAGLRAL